MRIRYLLACSVPAFALMLGMATCATATTILLSDSLDSSVGWTDNSEADTTVTFGYDYSADGIPSAPNGAGTVGVKLTANNSGTTGAAAVTRALSSIGYTPGAPYTVQVDFWSNFELNSGSSTEFTGAGVGHDGATAGRNGASLLSTGDGGSSRDYRFYKDASEQFIASTQYNPVLASNNGSDPAISAAFPATANTDAGDAGYQWMTMLIEVDPSAGLASYTLTSDASGNSLLIGTLDSNIGSSVGLEGSVALIHADLFSSVNTTGDNFGVFDNLVVTQIPEPATCWLLLSGAGLVSWMRRRTSAA